MVKKLSITIASCLFCIVTLSAQGKSQDMDAKLIISPEFRLSAAATAARIEGNLKVHLTVDKSGRVKNVHIRSTPAWPCGTDPRKEVDEVLDAVRENVLTTKFSPALRKGKPRDSELILTFVVGKTYRHMVTQSGLKSVATLEGAPPRYSEPGKLNGRALYLPKPQVSDGIWRSGAYGSVTTQILIDEKGNVISVGMLYGREILFPPVRAAACAAKFPPFLIRGQPVQVSGIVVYAFERAPYVPTIRHPN